MAWQLIYTSSPRLLQAGRTGFGTVAKHAAIRGALQSELERFSQFSRIEGLRSDRTLYYHRVLSVQGETFHVITRLKDAGFDYTGRTNHIAHHIVIPSSELAVNPKGLSPVDVILAFTHKRLWRDTWDEAPLEFSPAEDISLASLPRTLKLPAEQWRDFTGSAANAAILAPGEVAESCWLHSPPEDFADRLLPLIGESLLLHPAPWQISFATEVQPTDRIEEISWRGVPTGSPVSATAAQSVRPTVNLTDPAALPTIVLEYSHLAEHGTSDPARAPRASSTTFPPLRAEAGGGFAARSTDPISTGSGSGASVDSRTPTKLQDLIKPKRATARKKSTPAAFFALAAIFVILATAGFGIYWYFQEVHAKSVAELGAASRAIESDLGQSLPVMGSLKETPTAELKAATENLSKISNFIQKKTLTAAIQEAKDSQETFSGNDTLSNVFNDIRKKLEARVSQNEFHTLLEAGDWQAMLDLRLSPDTQEGATLRAINKLKDTQVSLSPDAKLAALYDIAKSTRDLKLSPKKIDKLDEMMASTVHGVAEQALKPENENSPPPQSLNGINIALKGLDWNDLGDRFPKSGKSLSALRKLVGKPLSDPQQAAAADIIRLEFSELGLKDPSWLKIVEKAQSPTVVKPDVPSQPEITQNIPKILIFENQKDAESFIDSPKNKDLKFARVLNLSVKTFSLIKPEDVANPNEFKFKEHLLKAMKDVVGFFYFSSTADMKSVQFFGLVKPPKIAIKLTISPAEINYDAAMTMLDLSTIKGLLDRFYSYSGSDLEALNFKWVIETKEGSSGAHAIHGDTDTINFTPRKNELEEEIKQLQEENAKIPKPNQKEVDSQYKEIADLFDIGTRNGGETFVSFLRNEKKIEFSDSDIQKTTLQHIGIFPEYLKSCMDTIQKNKSGGEKIKFASQMTRCINKFSDTSNPTLTESVKRAKSEEKIPQDMTAFLTGLEASKIKIIDELIESQKESAALDKEIEARKKQIEEAQKLLAILNKKEDLFSKLKLVAFGENNEPLVEISFKNQ